MPRRKRHPLEKHVFFSNGEIHAEQELELGVTIARTIRRATIGRDDTGRSVEADRGALRSAIFFASATTFQTTTVFLRNTIAADAKIRHLHYMEGLRQGLRKAGIPNPDIVAESTMRIGYFLYLLPRRTRMSRFNLSVSSPFALTWPHWVQMARFLDDDIDGLPLDPPRYLADLWNTAETLAKSGMADDVLASTIQRLHDYRSHLKSSNRESLERWIWLTVHILNEKLTPKQLARRRPQLSIDMKRSIVEHDNASA